MRFFVSTILLVGSMVSGAPADGQQHPLEPIVEQYLSLYVAGDMDALGEMLADDAVFEDPSQMLHGRAGVVSGLKQAFAGFTIEGFDEDRRIYSSPGHVLLVGRIRFLLHGPGGDSPPLDVPFGLSLKIADGKIVRHVDFVDAIEFSRQMRGG